MNEETAMIAVDKLLDNPDNPRRETEDDDIEELVASIRANGILQNLVVMPSGEPGKYILLAGHRRRMAAVRAGLTHVPCRIRRENIARTDQVAIMVSENASRKGLRFSEEAGAIQLMLDLGEDMDSISAKTGFSKTKVRHRAGIAQLDQETLRRREADKSFQLTITDLITLGQLKDRETRNKVLAEAKGSKDLAYKAQAAADAAKREANLKKIIPLLEAAGIKAVPEEASSQIYDSSKWCTIETIDLSEEPPTEYRLKEAVEQFYYRGYRDIKIIKRAEKKAKANLSEAEKKKREQEREQNRNRKALAALAKELIDDARRDFVMGVINKKIAGIKGEELAKAQAILWEIIFSVGANMPRNNCIAFYCNKKNYYDAAEGDRKTAGAWVDKLDMVSQLLILACLDCPSEGLIAPNGEYRQSAGERMKKLYSALALFGLRLDKEAKQILDGKHSLYYMKPVPVVAPPKTEKAAAKKKTVPVKKAAAKTESKKAVAKPTDKAVVPDISKDADKQAAASEKSEQAAGKTADNKAVAA